MATDDPVTKETYIKLLVDTLSNKLQVIDQLIALSLTQENEITSDTFDEKYFEELMDQKSTLIEKLNQLDTGFDTIYQAVDEELKENKEKYKDAIIVMQGLIKKITDKSVELQALEIRNRDKLEQLLSQKRKEIKSSRVLGKTAANYYKTMVNQHEQKSFFYDTKK
jgi:tRNA U55 pseudouridine synthase TruB